jgi:hypothetical protein
VTDDEKPRTRRPSLARRVDEAMRRQPGEMPGPFGRTFWRSPIRGPWLTSVLGLVLLAGVSVVFVTGLLSYAAYNPDLDRINDTTRLQQDAAGEDQGPARQIHHQPAGQQHDAGPGDGAGKQSKPETATNISRTIRFA